MALVLNGGSGRGDKLEVGKPGEEIVKFTEEFHPVIPECLVLGIDQNGLEVTIYDRTEFRQQTKNIFVTLFPRRPGKLRYLPKHFRVQRHLCFIPENIRIEAMRIPAPELPLPGFPHPRCRQLQHTPAGNALEPRLVEELILGQDIPAAFRTLEQPLEGLSPAQATESPRRSAARTLVRTRLSTRFQTSSRLPSSAKETLT
jgi:hypothetical protein